MTVDTMTDEFRQGLTRGELLVQKCLDCGALTMYPKYACPSCQSERLGWTPSPGRGILHSYTVMRLGAPIGFEDDLPYALGIVHLDEGVQLLGRLIPGADGTWDGYELDSRIAFVPEGAPDGSERPVAWFGPAEG
jgi:uncharacterized protein